MTCRDLFFYRQHLIYFYSKETEVGIENKLKCVAECSSARNGHERGHLFIVAFACVHGHIRSAGTASTAATAGTKALIETVPEAEAMPLRF